MKHFKKLAIAAAVILLSTTATAQHNLWNQTTHNSLNENDSSTILSIHWFSDHYFTASYTEQTATGSSTTAPCSDLKDWEPTSEESEEFYDMTAHLSSAGIVNYYGAGLTCFKTDLTINGNTYSTGEIQVIWDDATKTYTAANPNKVLIDLSNADKKNTR